MLQRLWRDSHGGVISPELAIIGVILVIGVIAGLGAIRVALLTEVYDTGKAVETIDFTPKITPIPDPQSASDEDDEHPHGATAEDVFHP